MTDLDDADVLAAEYVLGTLDAAERRAVAGRLGTDDALRRSVEAWETRLGPLAEAAPEVVPPDDLLPSLLTRLFSEAGSPPSATVADLALARSRLRRWQVATAGLAALAASLLGFIGVTAYERPAEDLVAVLQPNAGAPAILLAVDLRTRQLTVRPVGATSPVGKSFELWLIDPRVGPPRSLGTVAAGRGRASLSTFDPAVITDATYAVTIEPAGGSATGVPSGAPVLAGHLARD